MSESFEIEQLAAFGAMPENVVELADLDHRHLNYLDLPGMPPHLPRIRAVVEMAGRPVLYVAKGPLSDAQLAAVRHILAQRGAADHLGILEPGVMTVVPLLKRNQNEKDIGSKWRADAVSSRARLAGLAFGTEQASAQGTANRLHERLVKLLTSATATIAQAGVERPEDALSLVGRALFLRFLLDRRIVTTRDAKTICPSAGAITEALGTPALVNQTSRWLDETFNGNLLPLSHNGGRRFWASVGDPQAVCGELQKILCKADASGQLRFDWDTLDFGHIPVGLLSQVYERWCHDFAPAKAIRDSVWYTPRSIADYVVDEAFYGMESPHLARVLDPAVGAGVFLVSAYRELVAARWRNDGRRPTRKTLRNILYKQLVGFDVNEASLRLTALALYLTALELDPSPQVAEGLQFDDLRERKVLVDIRAPADKDDPALPMLGSLGPHIDESHRGAYDVVLGNPPWTSWTAKTNADRASVMVRRRTVEQVITPLVRERLASPNAVYEMVDGAPDVSFCWRATEWAKPGGTIAFALHSRLLFRQSPSGTRAREQLFGAVKISGILNGSALSQTMVWPSHEAPFCLLFASNQRPHAADGFQLVSPVLDAQLNREGHLRIDADAARPVFHSQVSQLPWLLKTLYRGTSLDVPIVKHLTALNLPSIAEYWAELGLPRTRGYVEGANRDRKSLYEHLNRLPVLTAHTGKPPRVDIESLPIFEARKVEAGRRADNFRGPLVLVFEAPRHDLATPRALWAEDDVAFNHVFYGFSAAGNKDSRLLASYLLVLLNSSHVLYLALMTSSMFAVQRKKILFEDLLNFPIVPLERLSVEQRKEIRTLKGKIVRSESLPQIEIDAFTSSILGLSRWDAEVIRDTLDVALPFSGSMKRAQARPSRTEVHAFVERVVEIVRPVFGAIGQHFDLAVHEESAGPTDSWIVLTAISTRERKPQPASTVKPAKASLDAVWRVALEDGASRVQVRTDVPGEVLIGIFAQYRYWTLTQARRLALDLLDGKTIEQPTAKEIA